MEKIQWLKEHAIAAGVAIRGFRDRVADFAHAHKNTTAFLLIVGWALAIPTVWRFVPTVWRFVARLVS
jgi:hypothetical protein